jgi:hypothetical protein
MFQVEILKDVKLSVGRAPFECFPPPGGVILSDCDRASYGFFCL